MIADPNHQIAKDYDVLIEEEGIALRGLFIIDPKGILRQITVNDLPVGRSVDETVRLIKAFQFVVCAIQACPDSYDTNDLSRRSMVKSALLTGRRERRP